MRLVIIRVLPVAVKYGWLVTSTDARWKRELSSYFPSKKPEAIDYARQCAALFEGASVRIHGKNGRVLEERTYPRSADPRRSKG